MGIKDILLKWVSFYENIGEAIIYIVITGKRYSSLHIWPEAFYQGIATEDMILRIWYKEAMK